MAFVYCTGATLNWYVSAAYVKIGQLKSISDTDLSQEPIDITMLDDTGKQWAPGTVTDWGEYSFQIGYDFGDATHQALLALADASTNPVSQDFNVTYARPSSVVRYFSGIVYKVNLGEAASNSVLMATVTIKKNTNLASVDPHA